MLGSRKIRFVAALTLFVVSMVSSDAFAQRRSARIVQEKSYTGMTLAGAVMTSRDGTLHSKHNQFERCYVRSVPRGFSNSFLCREREKRCASDCRLNANCAGYAFTYSNQNKGRRGTLDHGRCTMYRRTPWPRVTAGAPGPSSSQYPTNWSWSAKLFLQQGDSAPSVPAASSRSSSAPKPDANRAKKLNVPNATITTRGLATRSARNESECYSACLGNSSCRAYVYDYRARSCSLHNAMGKIGKAGGTSTVTLLTRSAADTAKSMNYSVEGLYTAQTRYIAKDGRLYDGGSKNIVWDTSKRQKRITGVSTVHRCRLLCFENQSCRALQYNGKSDTCELFGGNAEPFLGSPKSFGALITERRPGAVSRAIYTSSSDRARRPAAPGAAAKPAPAAQARMYNVSVSVRIASNVRQTVLNQSKQVACTVAGANGRRAYPKQGTALRSTGGKYMKTTSAKLTGTTAPLTISCGSSNFRGGASKNLPVTPRAVQESQIRGKRNPSVTIECDLNRCRVIRVGEAQKA